MGHTFLTTGHIVRELNLHMLLEIFSVRATVATQTLVAPARRNTRAHSDTVAPVVYTSSTSSTS